MDKRILAAISLNNHDFPSLQAKLSEAVKWVELAAGSGAALAVLPECLNKYRGDGPGNPRALSFAEMGIEDWQRDCAMLIDAARRCRIALTIPIIRRQGDSLVNCFLLISKTGELLGEYHKRFPTPAELHSGIRPGRTPLIEWEGLQIGGAICFDTLFPEVFRDQAEQGADLFLVPSFWPGGSNLDFYAMEYSCPIVLAYPAWSRILDADGQELAAGGYRWETLRFGFGSPLVLATVNFDQAVLFGNHNQEQMVEVQRAYGKQVGIRFNQANVTFKIESLSAEVRIEEVIRRFGLIVRRQYLNQCSHEAKGMPPVKRSCGAPPQ